MLSALFGSPRFLLQKEAQAEQVAAEQRVSQARRRSLGVVQSRSRSNSTEAAAAADAKSPSAQLLRHDLKDGHALESIKPTLRDRRASLGLETEAAIRYKNDTNDGFGDEIPAAADQPTGRHSRAGSFPTPAVLPYTLQSNGAKEDELQISDTMPGDPELPSPVTSQPPSNNLALIDLPALFSSVTGASSKARGLALLSKAARVGFESHSQRAEVWKRMVVLPSAMTQVDRMAYFNVVESCFRLREGAVKHLASKLITLEEESVDLNSEPLQALRAELRAAMPTHFPNPPLLGRLAAFDFAAQVPPGTERALATEMVLAPKRIVCALSFATPELSYAPQLAALVSLLYHTFGHDEATTFAFARAMLDRSGRDEFFVLRAPSSSVLVNQGFARVVEKHLPVLYAHLSLFTEIGGTRVESKWFAGWMQDMFIGALPNEAVARMVDLAMAVGIVPAAYKLGLQVLALFSPYLLSTKPVVGGLAELEHKLAKLMSIANIPSLFGADACGISWASDTGLYTAKKDLTRLTTPIPLGAHKDACISLDSLVAPEDTHLGLESLLAAHRFHQPSFNEEQHYARGSRGSAGHKGLMDTRTLLQLYSGILPAPSSQMDPTLVFASNRDGHSLRGMVGRLSAFHDAYPAAGGVLLLLRENGTDAALSKKKGRVLALFLNRWPKDLAMAQAAPSSTSRARSSSDAGSASDAITLESGGFVAEFPEVALHAAGELDPRWLRFGGGLRVDGECDTIKETESKESREAREVDSPPQTDSETAEAPTSLPVLPVERPDSSVKPPLTRRGSLAALMGALHLTKTDESAASEEAPNAANSPAAQKLLALVPKLSPFRHQGLRVIETVGSKALIHAAVHASQQQQHHHSDSTGSTVTSSVASSPAPSRRASLVAGLSKVWSFIDSVPTPLAQSAANSALSSRAGSKVSSPATSRRGSLNLQSTRNASSGSTDGQQRPPLSVFFSLGGSSPSQSNLSSPIVASSRNSSLRSNPPLTALRGRPPTGPLLSSPAASREVMAGIERHLSLARKESDSHATQVDSPKPSLQRRVGLPTSVRVSGLTDSAPQQSQSRPRSPEPKLSQSVETGSGRPRMHRAMSLPSPISPPIAAAVAAHAALVVAPTPQRKHAASTSSTTAPSLTVPARSVNSSPNPSGSSRLSPSAPPSPVASPGPESLRSPVSVAISASASSTPISKREPTIASLCASFRNQHGFNLHIEEDDGEQAQLSENSHCDTVRAALSVIHRGAVAESSDHHPTMLVGARMQLTSDALLISAPAVRLLWSVDGTLEEGCVSWHGLQAGHSTSDPSSDPASCRVEIGSLECWSFQ